MEQELPGPLADLRLGGADGGMACVHFSSRARREVVADGVRDDEVAVGQALHERAGAQTVGAVVREIRLAEHVQAGNGAHQVVVHPQPAHGVVHRREDPHRHLIGISSVIRWYIWNRLP